MKLNKTYSKKLAFIIFSSCLALFISWPLLKVARASKNNSSTIKEIRSEYKNINKNLTQYKLIKKNIDGYSAEGSELKAYYDKAQLKKLSLESLGEMGRHTEDFYFKNNILFFSYSIKSTYDKPFGKIEKNEENRYYFNNGKLIRWIDPSKKQIPYNKKKFENRGLEIIQFSDELKRLVPQETSK